MKWDKMDRYTTVVYVKTRTSNLNNVEFNFDNKYEFHIVNEEELSCKYFLSVQITLKRNASSATAERLFHF